MKKPRTNQTQDASLLANWIERSEKRQHTKDWTDETLDRAFARIQASPGQYGGPRPCALAWLLAFVQDDPMQYSDRTLIDRWWEVRRFAVDAGLASEDNRVCRLMIDRPALGRWPETDDHSRRMLARLQQHTALLIEWYCDGTGEVGTGELRLSFRVKRGRPGVWAAVTDEQTAFTYQTIHLLADLGTRILRCRCCHRYMLAGRTDKQYCSNRCQSAHYKQIHKGKTRKRTSTHPSRTKGGGHASSPARRLLSPK